MIGRATGEENEPFLSGCRARTRGRLVSWAIGWTGLAGALATGSGYEADRPVCTGSSNTEPRVRALYCALTNAQCQYGSGLLPLTRYTLERVSVMVVVRA